MRTVLALILLLGVALAGCGQLAGDGFDVSCPTWHENKNRASLNFNWYEDETTDTQYVKEMEVGKGSEWAAERPLDKFDLRIADSEAPGLEVAEATLILHVYAGDSSRALPILDAVGRPLGTELRFTERVDEAAYMVRLTAPGEEPAPTHVRIVWTFEPHGGRETPSGAVVKMSATLWHLDARCT